MHKNAIRYRDTFAAPGSQLHEAITNGDQSRAAGIYSQCEREAAQLMTRRDDCECRACLAGQTVNGIPLEMTRMILCASCGNKRCPHANDHRNACTGSNEPGQPGSAYA